MNNIQWIEVEGYRNTKFISAHSIRGLKVELSGIRRAPPDCTHKVLATMQNGTQYPLKTASEQTCQLYLIQLIKQTGVIFDPLAKFESKDA